jgi:hypothetical protein
MQLTSAGWQVGVALAARVRRTEQREAVMTIRVRGLLIFLASLVTGVGAYWLVFHILSKQLAQILQYALALPILGMLIGGLELITGVPISRLDEGWQKLPAYVKVPVGLIGGLLFLWGLVKVLGF